LTKSAKVRELEMIGDKEDLEKYKEALLMKEEESLRMDREV
jgi:hypothetical protein